MQINQTASNKGCTVTTMPTPELIRAGRAVVEYCEYASKAKDAYGRCLVALGRQQVRLGDEDSVEPDSEAWRQLKKWVAPEYDAWQGAKRDRDSARDKLQMIMNMLIDPMTDDEREEYPDPSGEPTGSNA